MESITYPTSIRSNDAMIFALQVIFFYHLLQSLTNGLSIVRSEQLPNSYIYKLQNY